MKQTDFKSAVGKFITGVTVISTRYNHKLYGFTANSFTSVSLEPRLVSFCLSVDAGSFAAFSKADYFSVSVLNSDQALIADHFASTLVDKFDNISYDENEFGIPVIKNALSYIECTKYQQIPAGDHYIFIGEVIKASCGIDRSPLVYYGKSYKEFTLKL